MGILSKLKRKKDIDTYLETGKLNVQSNVQH